MARERTELKSLVAVFQWVREAFWYVVASGEEGEEMRCASCMRVRLRTMCIRKGCWWGLA